MRHPARAEYWVRPQGLTVGPGGHGPDPSIPECPICHAHGGGGHGGGCPNHGMTPDVWLVEAQPGHPAYINPPSMPGAGWTVSITDDGRTMGQGWSPWPDALAWGNAWPGWTEAAEIDALNAYKAARPADDGGHTERKPPLITEPEYNQAAAQVGKNTNEVLTWARDEDDVNNQLITEIEQTAETLAAQGQRLRVVARWLAADNHDKLAALADEWDRQAIVQRESGHRALAKQLHNHAEQLRHVLGGG